MPRFDRRPVALGTAAIGAAAVAWYLGPPLRTQLLGTRGLMAAGAASVQRDNSGTIRTQTAPRASVLRLAAGDEALRPNMFAAPEPELQRPVPGRPSGPRTGPTSTDPSLPEEDPLADAVYAGFVTVDGSTRALVETVSSGQGDYLNVGAGWHGYRIIAITPREITLSVNGRTRSLPISDAFNTVPLRTNAPGTLRDVNVETAGQVAERDGQDTMNQYTYTAEIDSAAEAALLLRTQALDIAITNADLNAQRNVGPSEMNGAPSLDLYLESID